MGKNENQNTQDNKRYAYCVPQVLLQKRKKINVGKTHMVRW